MDYLNKISFCYSKKKRMNSQLIILTMANLMTIVAVIWIDSINGFYAVCEVKHVHSPILLYPCMDCQVIFEGRGWIEGFLTNWTLLRMVIGKMKNSVCSDVIQCQFFCTAQITAVITFGILLETTFWFC